MSWSKSSGFDTVTNEESMSFMSLLSLLVPLEVVSSSFEALSKSLKEEGFPVFANAEKPPPPLYAVNAFGTGVVNGVVLSGLGVAGVPKDDFPKTLEAVGVDGVPNFGVVESGDDPNAPEGPVPPAPNAEIGLTGVLKALNEIGFGLENGDDAELFKLEPKAPNPSDGLNTDGVVVRFPNAPPVGTAPDGLNIDEAGVPNGVVDGSVDALEMIDSSPVSAKESSSSEAGFGFLPRVGGSSGLETGDRTRATGVLNILLCFSS